MMKTNNHKKISLIFDLDGTLIHSIPDMHVAIVKSLKKFKLKYITQDQLRFFIGEGMLKLSERVVLFCGGEKSIIPQFYESYRQNYSLSPYKFSKYMPGAEKVLSILYNKNIPMSICTNKRQSVTLNLLNKVGITHYFRSIVGAQSKIPLKPNKDMIEKVMSDFDHKYYNFYMIGDTENDIQAAKNAGINSIFVKGGYSNKSETQLNPNFVINNMGELINLLEFK